MGSNATLTTESSDKSVSKLNQRNGTRRVLIGVGVFIAIGVIVLMCLYIWAPKAERIASIGDAAAPLVSLVSLAAVGVAVWSIDLQRKQIERQDAQIEAQQTAIAEQLKVQNQTLALQKEDFDARVKTQKQDALRTVYGPLHVALRAYDDALEKYQIVVRGNGFDISKINASEWNDGKSVYHARLLDDCDLKHDHVAQLAIHAAMVEQGRARTTFIRQAFSQKIRLLPPFSAPVPATMKEWFTTVTYRHNKLKLDFSRLRESLDHELFGNEPTQDPDKEDLQRLVDEQRDGAEAVERNYDNAKGLTELLAVISPNTP